MLNITRVRRAVGSMPHTAAACAALLALGALAASNPSAPPDHVVQGAPGAPYPNMPAIAPIGVRVGKYMDVPESAKGPSVDPAKGYRTQDLGTGLYMVTDNGYQSMFMVYETGVVVVDAPPSYSA